ncbi:putative drug resistance protein [Neofusicoccum parvum UCRNP2]|uniref:Putative drug resistance protein n=1 Tax=Botryosphaeria parva (strain UCR-NP2) TaxID=1287680 RepID=R1E7W0_BOTPV|nr:putative drug resistance protein [Neofusicoccum parvum UCRNP2]
MDIDAGNPALAVSRVASARSSTRSDIEAASVAGSASHTAADEKKQRATSNDGQEDAVPSSDSDIGRDEERGAAPAPAQDDHGRSHYSKVRLLSLVLTVTGAAFLNTLGVQAAVIVLPTIGRDLSIPDSRQQWIVSAYSLTFGCFLLLWGRLADVYGKRLIFIWGSAWLTVITVVLPFVKSEIGFDVLRGLQGLGAAANVPTAIGILGVTFPPGRAKNYAFSCYGAGAPLGSIFGNLMGGVIGEYASWKWVFWVLGILAALVTLAGIFIIPPPPIQNPNLTAKSAVDWIGGTLVTVGLMVLMFALTEGNVVGWSTPWVPTLIVASVAILLLFVLWQRYLETKTTQRPLMKVSIFHNLRFSAAMVIMLLFFAAFNNYLIFATYFFQDYLGLSVIQTTLRFIPTGVCGIIIAFATGFFLSRVPGNYILMFGTLSVSVSVLLFATPIPPHTTYWAYGLPAMVLAVFGADTVYPCLTLFTAKSLPQEDQALGGALINAVGQIGRAIGLAIATAVETAVIAAEKGVSVDAVGGEDMESGDSALLSGLRAAEWFTFGLAIAAFALAGVAFRGAGYIGKKH